MSKIKNQKMGTKMKSAKKATSKTNYEHVETNIYRTGTRYRIRVGTQSAYATSLKEARRVKKLFKGRIFDLR